MTGIHRRTGTTRASAHAKRNAVLGLAVSGSTLLVLGLVSRPSPAYAAEAPVGLGTAAEYSVLGGQTVTNTGPSTLSGDLGVSPGTAITGFPPGTAGGATHAGDEPAAQAQSDLVIAYADAASRAPTALVAGDLVGQTLTAGVFKSTGPLAVSGTVTLDGQGDPNSVFIFQIASTLITASASDISVINGAQACHVFWQVGSSATLGTNSDFVGTIMALTSISVTTNTVVAGRALARNGQVSLDNNTFTMPGCETAPTSTSTAPTSTTTSSTTPTTDSTTTTSDTPTSSSPTTTSTESSATSATSDTTTDTSDTSDTSTTESPTSSSPPTESSPESPTSSTSSDTSTTETTDSTTSTSDTATSSSPTTTSTESSTTDSTTSTSPTTETSTTTTTSSTSTTPWTATISEESGPGPSGGSGGGPQPTGPAELANTGATISPGPLVGLGALLLMLGGSLLAIVRIRSRLRSPRKAD